MCHKCTLYIHRYRSNVHCSVHKLYIKCTSDEGICCMYNVHKISASKKMLKVHRKYYKSTSQNYIHACQKCTLHENKMHMHTNDNTLVRCTRTAKKRQFETA